jgi:hypothetical protein
VVVAGEDGTDRRSLRIILEEMCPDIRVLHEPYALVGRRLLENQDRRSRLFWVGLGVAGRCVV